MFFTISKILGFLLNPLVWILGLLVFGILNRTYRRRSTIAATAILYFLSTFFTYNIASTLWDYHGTTVDDIVQPFDLGIVLSGYAVLDSELINYPSLLHLGNNANRLTQSLELYKMGKIKKIMISGGSGYLTGEKLSEAHVTYDFLLKMGVKEEDILLEGKSRNTIENARESKVFLENHSEKFERILLITSDFHMRRSKACFDKVGLITTPFLTGSYYDHYEFNISDLLPHPSAFQGWHSLIREWAAIIVYKMLGYI